MPGLSVLIAVAVINGGWLLRNLRHFGVMSEARQIVLSTREVFDNMTAAEHAVAFLWFIAAGRECRQALVSGKGLAPFPMDGAGGVYLRGQVYNHDARVARLMSETGVSEVVAQSRAGAVVVKRCSNWTGYIASMPAVFSRGLSFDAFMPLSLHCSLPFLWAQRESGGYCR